MNAIFEYILAALFMLMMLIAVQTTVFNYVSERLALAEQEDYSMAASILDTILLSPGNPPNWGDSVNDPVMLGLASYVATETYTLDAKKVIRLSENYSSYISPGDIRSLLRLSTDYDLVIKITPVLIINIEPQGGADYLITVKNYNGIPAASVNITGFYVHKSLDSHLDRYYTSTITGIDGKCTLSFNPKTDYVPVVCANLLEVKTMQTYPTDLAFRVEGNSVVKSDVPLISSINYTTGSFYRLSSDKASRYVNIDGYTYCFELEIWR